METMKMLGVVALYHADKKQATENVALYAPYLDELIVWDNSPENHAEWFSAPNITYHWTGTNTCIAPAINYALHHALNHGFHTLLLMDDDSRWPDFPSYRRDVERALSKGRISVFTPYVDGVDQFEITQAEQPKRLFINSGTVVPISILQAIGGIDADAFPLDAIDHDIAFSIIEHGWQAVCLTRHRLNHSLGYPQRMGPFRIFTPNYNSFRTYSMTRSHIICYRKHRMLMTAQDRDYLFNEILRRKLVRILLAEPDKLQRLWAFVKGVAGGCCYRLKKTQKTFST